MSPVIDHERYIRGDHRPEASGARSVRSGLVTVVARGAQLALQLGLVMILGRLLTPEDFGVQAMIFPVAILMTGITNTGVQSAVIQRDDLDHPQASALFWTSLRWNLALCGAMALAAPVLALAFREPRALGIGLVWSAVMFCATLSAIHEGLLKRQFRFTAVLGAQLAALVISIVVAVIAARLGARHWTFMLQVAVMEVVRVLIVWVICPWRPALHPDPQQRVAAARALRTYWKGFAGARALGWTGEQADRLTVGVIGGAPLLGLYDNAKRWGTFAFIELYLSLSEVAIASLSRVRNDAQLFARYAQAAFLPVLAVSLPIVAFMFAEARGVLLFLLGPQWTDAAGMMRALCLATAFTSIGRLVQWVLLSTGATGRQFRWTMISTPVLIAGAVIGARYGAFGVGVGVAIANGVLTVPTVMNAIHGTALRLRDVLATYLLPLVASAAAATVLLTGDAWLVPADSVRGLFVRGVVFSVVYVAAWLVLPSGRRRLAALRDARPMASAVVEGGSPA